MYSFKVLEKALSFLVKSNALIFKRKLILNHSKNNCFYLSQGLIFPQAFLTTPFMEKCQEEKNLRKPAPVLIWAQNHHLNRKHWTCCSSMPISTAPSLQL